MSEEAKIDKLMELMESMMISVDKSMKGMESRINSRTDKLDTKIDNLRTEMKIEFEETNRKIELVAENITKTSNYELEKRIEVIEKRLGIA